MKLCLRGHDYKYAAEQMFLMFFPDEKPRYELSPEGDCALLSLDARRARAEIRLGGRLCAAESPLPPLPEEGHRRDSVLQKHLKLAFFAAASDATGLKPPWGALTGIRPAKIAERLISAGEDAESGLEREYFVLPEQARAAAECARVSISVKNSLEERDAALYLGVPFCPSRCSYCSFVSHSVEKSMKLVEPYLAALACETRETGRIARENGLRIRSVYIGGGTPTTLSAEQLRRVMGGISDAFDLSHIDEYTVEAGRADTIDAPRLSAIRDGGADRISVNPQTMDDAVLRAIGRKHTAEQAERAFELVSRFGFRSVNADLIAGLPLDTPGGFERSLERVMGFKPENITVHTLALKRAARIAGGEPGAEGLKTESLPGAAAVGAMLASAREMLRGAEYFPYYLYRQKFTAGGFENIGWSKRGFESAYNVCIMEELCTVLALGAGGVTKLVAPKCGKIERICGQKYPYEYNSGVEKTVLAKEKIADFLAKYE